MSYNIFLDKKLTPADVYIDILIEDYKKPFFTTTSFDEFKQIIDTKGIPDFVSFGDVNPKDCFKYLFDKCQSGNFTLPNWRIHFPHKTLYLEFHKISVRNPLL